MFGGGNDTIFRRPNPSAIPIYMAGEFIRCG